jgi:putative colanic acid biosynthesis acetyltransferase WcaB
MIAPDFCCRRIDPLFVDWAVNSGRPKIQISLAMFRAAASARQRFGPRSPISVALGGLYRIGVEWLLGIEIPWQTEVGPRLRIYHGYSIVVNPYSKLGADVSLRQGVTIGNRKSDTDCPTIHDGTDLGAYSAVLGDVIVGAHAVIGAHAVVLKSVPAGATAVGNPARILAEKRP